MKKHKNTYSIIISLLFYTTLSAAPAAPHLITFEQPDGSKFNGFLKGDEYFSWIETENKMILVKSKTSGFFEFALIKMDQKKRLILLPSGVTVIEQGHSSLKTNHNIPKISPDQLREIWQNKIDERKNIELIPAN